MTNGERVVFRLTGNDDKKLLDEVMASGMYDTVSDFLRDAMRRRAEQIKRAMKVVEKCA